MARKVDPAILVCVVVTVGQVSEVTMDSMVCQADLALQVCSLNKYCSQLQNYQYSFNYRGWVETKTAVGELALNAQGTL